MTTPAQQQAYVHIPGTVSQQAQAFLRTLQNPALMPAFPEPDDLAGWEKLRAFAEADGKASSAPLLQRYAPTVTEGRLGGVPVLDVRPQNWQDNGKVAVYTHGGAHVMYSAASMLGRAVVFAHATGLRVISVEALVGFQGLMLTCASETRKSLIRPLKNNDFKEAAGCKNRVVRSCYIHVPGIQ